MIWDAEILGQEGNNHTIRSADWNKDIVPRKIFPLGLLVKVPILANPQILN